MLPFFLISEPFLTDRLDEAAGESGMPTGRLHERTGIYIALPVYSLMKMNFIRLDFRSTSWL